MEEIINQIIANRNYHMLSDEQVEALEQLIKANKVLCEMVDERDDTLSKISEKLRWLIVIRNQDYIGIKEKYRPIKNTTRDECYEAIVKIKEMLRR